jgi:hypothetical protein
MAIPADRPFGAAHAEAEAGSRSYNGSTLEPAGRCHTSTDSTHFTSARSFDVRRSGVGSNRLAVPPPSFHIEETPAALESSNPP